MISLVVYFSSNALFVVLIVPIFLFPFVSMFVLSFLIVPYPSLLVCSSPHVSFLDGSSHFLKHLSFPDSLIFPCLIFLTFASTFFDFFILSVSSSCLAIILSQSASPGVNISSPTPDTTSGIGGPCPAGFYCPLGTHTPEPCLNGTYSDRTLLESAEDCDPCDLGMYCGTYNLTEPEGPCDPGFYCNYGASYPNPNGTSALT